MSFLSDHINVFGLVASLVIIFLVSSVASFYYAKMRKERAHGKLINHSWDGISEFASNVPFGWALAFTILGLWGFWYALIGFPLNAYSQIGDFNHEVATHNERFEARLQNLSHQDLIKMGENIFLVKCAQCHGAMADGNGHKAQNLTRWGKFQGIVDTIKHGSVGLGFEGVEMPAIEITHDEAVTVAKYVMATFSKRKENFSDLDVAKGKEIWENASCAGCHGEDGSGMNGFAANLTNYGTPEFLKDVLTRGKKGAIGQMPSFIHNMLSDVQIQAINAYILSLPAKDTDPKKGEK